MNQKPEARRDGWKSQRKHPKGGLGAILNQRIADHLFFFTMNSPIIKTAARSPRRPPRPRSSATGSTWSSALRRSGTTTVREEFLREKEGIQDGKEHWTPRKPREGSQRFRILDALFPSLLFSLHSLTKNASLTLSLSLLPHTNTNDVPKTFQTSPRPRR